MIQRSKEVRQFNTEGRRVTWSVFVWQLDKRDEVERNARRSIHKSMYGKERFK